MSKRKGSNDWNISFEEKEKLLSKFEEKANKGQIVEVSEIRKEYEKVVGHKIAPTQI